MADPVFVSGFGGSIEFETVELCVTEWTLAIKAEALDTTTTCSDGWAENIEGTKSWDGTAKAFLDTGDWPVEFESGSRGTVVLNVSETGKSYGGTVQITQFSVTNAAKGVVTFDLTFTGSGEITYAS